MSSLFSSLPERPGVYIFRGANRRILYIGKAKNLKSRVQSHFKNKASPKTTLLVLKIKKVEHIIVENEFDALLLEAALIKKHQPFFNTRAKDDKSPLFIKVTAADEFPRLFLVRREEIPGNLYFGPFPSSRTARQILQTLRKIFPYDSQKRIGQRACFWSHLGLCQPCPSIIQTLPKKERATEREKYQKNIKNLTAVLAGKSGFVRRRLISEINRAAKLQDFENAGHLRSQLNKLDYLYHTPQIIMAFNEETQALYLLLKKYLRLKKPPIRLECFDASHTALTSPTVGMVTFLNGEPEKNLYRRFKIKKNKTDDLAFLKEALTRRFRHLEWDKPDLLVIDGGKTQVGRGQEVLENLKISLPVVGLVKPFDNLIIPRGQKFLILPVNDGQAKRLLQRLRDEAHRFALAYHRHLRRKKLLNQ